MIFMKRFLLIWRNDMVYLGCLLKGRHPERKDVLIILGDAGINFSGRLWDGLKKQFLEEFPITLFCIHGNHEQRLGTIDTYKEMRLAYGYG